MILPPLSMQQELKNIRSNVREKIFLHKLIYDLKVSAVSSDFSLQVYEVEVDDAGYDIIVDDGQMQRKFQVKTRLIPGGAKSWSCHAELFCPSRAQGALWDINEWNNQEAWGYDGGLILMDIDWRDGQTPDVIYKYCDLRILMAYRDGFSTIKDKQTVAKKVYKKILVNPFSKKRRVLLPQSMFVTPKNKICMLSLMGFNVWMGADYNSSFLSAYSLNSRGKTQRYYDESFQKCFFKELKTRIV